MKVLAMYLAFAIACSYAIAGPRHERASVGALTVTVEIKRTEDRLYCHVRRPAEFGGSIFSLEQVAGLTDSMLSGDQWRMTIPASWRTVLREQIDDRARIQRDVDSGTDPMMISDGWYIAKVAYGDLVGDPKKVRSKAAEPGATDNPDDAQ